MAFSFARNYIPTKWNPFGNRYSCSSVAAAATAMGRKVNHVHHARRADHSRAGIRNVPHALLSRTAPHAATGVSVSNSPARNVHLYPPLVLGIYLFSVWLMYSEIQHGTGVVGNHCKHQCPGKQKNKK